jgi:hypothetical protein
MAVSAHFYGTPIKNWMTASADIDFDTDEFKVALVKSGYTPNVDTDDFWNDVSAEEASGTGYTAGGKKLTSPAVTYDSATNESRWDAADVEWPESTITARYAVVYKNTGTSSTSPLVLYVDFGENKSSSAGLFKIAWNALGLGYILAE